MAPTKTLDGSAFSFTTTRGHTTHISILWVFVLFTFLTVAVVLLGGYQEGLVERKLPDTKVSDKLEVRKGFQVKGAGAPGFLTGMSIDTITDNNAALLKDVLYSFLGSIEGDYTFTLPPAKSGSRTAFTMFQAVNFDNTTLAFTCSGDDEYQEGCVIQSGGAVEGGGPSVPVYSRSIKGDKILTYDKPFNGAEGQAMVDTGSLFYFYCAVDGFWQVFISVPNIGGGLGTGAVPSDSLTFSG